MIIHSSLSKIKNKILPTCFEEYYRDSLREFNSTSYRVFEAERGKHVAPKIVLEHSLVLLQFSLMPPSLNLTYFGCSPRPPLYLLSGIRQE